MRTSEVQNGAAVRRTTMVNAKNAIPQGFRSLTQYLILEGAARFFEFIQKAFGAREKFLMPDADGVIRHAEAWLGESVIEFAEANNQWKALPAGLHYYVTDSDESYARALKAGGTSLYEPANRDYGDREAGVCDPTGNFWFISTHKTGNSFKPEILQDLNTYFSVKGSARFLDFLEKALRADVLEKHQAGENIAHAKVRIGNSVVELSEGRAP